MATAVLDTPAREAETAVVHGADDAELESADTSLRPEAEVDRSGLIVPQKDEHFVVDVRTRAFLRAVARIRKEGPVNVALRGPTGAGKTSLAEWFAYQTRSPYFVLDMSTLREPKDLLGFKDLVMDPKTGERKIRWIKSAFVHAIQTPNTVVVLDEMTRIHPSVANTLMPLLDHRRQVYLDDLGELIRVAPGVVFMATANLGSEYTGTWRWDAALESRLEYQLEVSYLPRQQEIDVLVNKTGVDRETAEGLVDVANQARAATEDPKEPLGHAISTRQLLAASRLVVQGMPPADAMEFTVVPTYSPAGGTESDRAHILTIIQGKLGGS